MISWSLSGSFSCLSALRTDSLTHVEIIRADRNSFVVLAKCGFILLSVIK